MAKYDLTGSLEAEFTFAIGDKEFEFRKPTVREMKELSKKFASADKEEDLDKQEELNKMALGELYKFITATNHDEDLATLLDDQPVDVQTAFNEMIKKELAPGS